ncbi:MAG: MASE4 domain-containing protein [Alphaproteobacteria bacterium]|nr:MASE4 domain-containing protein [Alphaproteobacteria bacterium]
MTSLPLSPPLPLNSGGPPRFGISAPTKALEPEFVLATEPPTPGQNRFALSVVLVLLAVFAVAAVIGLTLPSALIPVRIYAFVPVLAALLLINDLITAALLFGQFSIVRSHALLVIANAYLFTGLMAAVFALTFPGEFSPSGLFGAGLQTSAWIYNFWHYGFPAAVIGYVILLSVGSKTRIATTSAVSLSVVIVLGLVSGLTWLATAGEQLLLPLFVDPVHPTPLARIVTSSNTILCLLALGLLYRCRRSVLDLWLVVVLCAWVSELAILDVLLYSRFTFGFYVGRTFSLITSVVVLVVLLQESMQLYARLARSNSALQRERSNKLLSLDAMAASIAHEVNQPLSALVTNGGIGLRLLAKGDVDLDEVRAVLKRIIDDGHRASDIIASMRAMFKSGHIEESTLRIRELIFDVLVLVHGELQSHGVSVQINLRPDLPRILGDRVQLQQVLVNLIMNAVEAMSLVESHQRSLLVDARLHGTRDVLITVEDSGTGIEAKDMEHIFETFFTTKPHGMGLGLAISRSIIEAHGGRLWASGRKPRGAVFHVLLPSDTSAER